MTWAALLLADPSPCLRWMVLTQLLKRPEDDPEVIELSQLKESDRLFLELQQQQGNDGRWQASDIFGSSHNQLLSTSQAMLRLGFLGFDRSSQMVTKAADFIFSQQNSDGSWPLPTLAEESTKNESYSMIPLQTAIPLRGLAACGYATDPRSEKAYQWLIHQRLPDGTWPTGKAAGTFGRVAGYRRLPHSRWGCRSNTTGALWCLALHPHRCTEEPARRALDILLGRESKEAANLGFEVARIIGVEPFRGFLTLFARFDPGLMLWFCARVGASMDDPRTNNLIRFIHQEQGPFGLWEYSQHPGASRWVTFDLLRSLSELDKNRDWISLEPPTPFTPEPYGTRPPRY